MPDIPADQVERHFLEEAKRHLTLLKDSIDSTEAALDAAIADPAKRGFSAQHMAELLNRAQMVASDISRANGAAMVTSAPSSS